MTMSGLGGGTLDFERPYVEILRKAAELRRLEAEGVDFSREIKRLEAKAGRLRRQAFRKLDALERRALAGHALRPQAADVAAGIVDGFFGIRGDRIAGDDPAIVAGLGEVGGRSVAIVGIQREPHGALDDTAIGLRKALRLIALARRFAFPVICLVDRTSGGEAATSRGDDGGGTSSSPGRALMAHAAAACLDALLSSAEPTVAVIVGELASLTGAALVACDRVLMLEHAIGATAPPEEVARHLWEDAAEVAAAARVSQLRAEDLYEAGFVDEVIEEPPGGAHRDAEDMNARIRRAVIRAVNDLEAIDPGERLKARRGRYVHFSGHR